MDPFFHLWTKSFEKKVIMILAKFKITVKSFLALGKGSQILPYTMCTLFSKKILVFNKKQCTSPVFSVKKMAVEHRTVK